MKNQSLPRFMQIKVDVDVKESQRRIAAIGLEHKLAFARPRPSKKKANP